MTKALIVFASMTGTTEEIAEILAQYLRELKVEVVVKECTDLYAVEFQDYDICVMATYTYGADGDLPEEAEDFYYDLEEVDLSGKIYGVLGSGDRIYKKFCPAVDDFERQFESTGAIRGAESLKINLAPDPADRADIQNFARNLFVSYNKQAE